MRAILHTLSLTVAITLGLVLAGEIDRRLHASDYPMSVDDLNALLAESADPTP